MKIVLISLYDEYCLGIRYLSSYLKSQNHSVYKVYLKLLKDTQDWRDGQIMPPDDNGYYISPCWISEKELNFLYEVIGEIAPEIVGISFTSNFSGLAIRLTQDIKTRYLNIITIWGGIDTIYNPEIAIKYADFICVGEGEYAFAELCERLEKGERFPTVEGLWTKRDTKEIIKTSPRKLEQNIDKFPFPDMDFTNDYFIRNEQCLKGELPSDSSIPGTLFVISQRGCPHSCTYCCYYGLKEMYKGQKVLRRRSLKNFLDELIQLKEKFSQVHTIEIWDDVFAIDSDWCLEFAIEYREKVGIRFACYVSPLYCEKSVLKALKEAGLFFTTLGVQSGSERVLNQIYNRRTKREQILKAAKTLNELGLIYVIDLIAYNPLEKEEDYLQTLDLLTRLPKPFRINTINPMSFYMNYEITNIALRESIELVKSESANKFLQTVTEEQKFWDYLLTLAQFDIEKDTLFKLVDDRFLRENPDVLKGVVEGFMKERFIDGNIASVMKNERIKELEANMGQLLSSRRYKLANIIAKLFGK